MLAFVGFMTYLAFDALITAARKSERNSFANILSFYLGSKAAKSTIVIILLTQFLLTTMQMVVLWNFIQAMLVKYNMVDLPYNGDNPMDVQILAPEVIIFRGSIMGVIC